MREKVRLEKYYLRSNEQLFLGMDIQARLKARIRHMVPAPKRPSRSKTSVGLDANSLLTGGPTDQGRGKLPSAQSSREEPRVGASISTERRSSLEIRVTQTERQTSTSTSLDPKRPDASGTSSKPLDLKVLMFLSQVKQRFGVQKLTRDSLMRNRQFLDFVFKLETNQRLKADVTRLQLELGSLTVSKSGKAGSAGPRGAQSNPKALLSPANSRVPRSIRSTGVRLSRRSTATGT